MVSKIKFLIMFNKYLKVMDIFRVYCGNFFSMKNKLYSEWFF